MRIARRSLMPLGLMLLAAVCGRARTSEEPAPQAETAVRVVNQSYLDMNVYVVRGGQRLRLGTVTGLSTQVFMLRPDMIGPAAEVQFEVHPIGGRGNPRTERITVYPGDVVELMIPPS